LGNGATYENIASIINGEFGTNYTRSAIWSRALRLNIPTPNPQSFWAEEHKQKLVELYNEDNGLSFAKMAAEINAAFGTEYSRKALIGQSRRMRLRGKRAPDSDKPIVPRDRKPRTVRTKAPDIALPALRCVEIEPMHVSFADLHGGMCKYPFGDDPATFTFCGHPQKANSPYCGPHHAIAYEKPRPSLREGRKFHGTDFARRSA
jgi:GcrA cell cycle regulator